MLHRSPKESGQDDQSQQGRKENHWDEGGDSKGFGCESGPWTQTPTTTASGPHLVDEGEGAVVAAAADSNGNWNWKANGRGRWNLKKKNG